MLSLKDINIPSPITQVWDSRKSLLFRMEYIQEKLIPAWAVLSCVTLGKKQKHSELQLSHL